jgi:hypothetical protein
MMQHKSLQTATLIASFLLQACGSLPRLDAVPPELTEKASIPGIPYARVWLDRDIEPFIQAVMRDIERETKALENAGLPTDPMPPVNSLAISGGGDEGAFAAGILAGWTARGDRPKFRVVTGISAGALIAPFAFLGPQYDSIVRDVATSIGPKDVFRKRNTIVGLTSDGMASSEPLAVMVAKYVTPEILEEIAREYEKGRVLQVGTADLDAGRQVIWNMGEIARSGAPGALGLFRKIIVASSSIPGVVSPVMIDVEVNGKPFQEMHVDGGVISQLFLYPSRLLPELQTALGKPIGREIHIFAIRNGRMEAHWSDTPRDTLRIGRRALEALIQAQGVNDVHQLFWIAQQDKTDFNLTYIGEDFEHPQRGMFDTAYMKSLYDYAYELASSGRAWHRAPPSINSSTN